MQQAIFGAGCFWGVEAAFAEMAGVTATEVGYSNGHTDKPTYEDVCSHTSGHAEVVRITFDPTKIEYKTLVEKFFDLHDPTQLNRQGPDVGDQYRSAIFYTSPEQEKIAKEVMAASASKFKRPIVTVIEPAQTFWRAEEYHQQYFAKRGGGSCHV